MNKVYPKVYLKVYLGLGSSDDNPQYYLNAAVTHLQRLSPQALRVSPYYQTPALLPEGAPPEWNKPYLNLVLEGYFSGEASDFLKATKEIEKNLGRQVGARWAPRKIDIDILLWNEQSTESESLTLPHPEMTKRAFVLDPLKDLAPNLELKGQTVLRRAREHPQHAPLFMGILNVTPDSFSDGGTVDKLDNLGTRLDAWDKAFVPLVDIGAESTRPGAQPLSADEEWTRLEPVLKYLAERYRTQLVRPQISLDTRHSKNAERALEYNLVRILNDVSGLADAKMLGMVKESRLQYVLTHSLGAPVEANKHLPENVDAVTEVKGWFGEKLSSFEKAGLGPDQIILDPGIGFGKTALQSLSLLRHLDQLTFGSPYRWLVGHSRKSFLASLALRRASERDLETLGMSLNLVRRGGDILRVHDPLMHQRAFQAWNQLNQPDLARSQ